MKLRYVVLIALAITVGPVGLGKLGTALFIWLYEHGTSFDVAQLASIGVVTFPFFFWCVWVLTNMLIRLTHTNAEGH